MSYARSNRHFPHKATYWSQMRKDGYGGESWVAPVVVACRWDDATTEELSVAYKVSGESVISNAKVYTEDGLVQGGYLYLGESTEANPSRLKGAFVIRRVTSLASPTGRFFEHAAYL